MTLNFIIPALVGFAAVKYFNFFLCCGLVKMGLVKITAEMHSTFKDNSCEIPGICLGYVINDKL